MESLYVKATDFGDYVTELTNWLTETGKEFPHKDRLMECGTGIRDSICMAKIQPECSRDLCRQTVCQTEEFQSLMEFMVKSGILTELQSKPLLSDCAFIREAVGKLMKKRRVSK